jgi:hypothetical protein
METPLPKKELMNPYLAGVLLGLTLLASFVILGAGLGASGGLARLAALSESCILPGHTRASEYFGPWLAGSPLRYYLVFMLAGALAGGLFSALRSGRFSPRVERGQQASRALRLGLALAGGVVAGFASRLAQGCTSGQALSGGALLLTGSLVFLGCVFAGGYAVAWFVRGQWRE